MEFIEKIKAQAKKSIKRIVLAEGSEERTLRAASQIIEEGVAEIILLGDSQEVVAKAQELGLGNIESGAEIVNPLLSDKREGYKQKMLELRAAKGLTPEQADAMLDNPLYYAVMMIKCGDADGEVAGAISATGDVLRPAFQFIKTKPGISVVSGSMLMILPTNEFGENGVMLFADCGVHPNPTAPELAEIAVSTAETAQALTGMEPRVAMLSFSTKGSAKHEMVDKVIEATEMAQTKAPHFDFEGELQADAAIVESVGQLKAPGSKIAGRANVLVFPTMESGNISYKLVQRIAGAEAVGPILQGIAAPINDLSRGCTVKDIVGLIAITACQCQE